jgi:hypothetical protein
MNKGITKKFSCIILEHIEGYNSAIDAHDEIKRIQVIARAQAKRCGDDYFLAKRINDDRNNEKARAELLTSAWESLIDKTKLSVLMDSETKSLMRDELKSSPPPLTFESVESVLQDLFDRKDKILADSLLNVFYGLNRKYKSNNKFRLTGGRIIVSLGVSPYNSTDKADKITDLDRIFHFLDGREMAGSAYDDTLGYKASYSNANEVQSDYIRIKLHANGNAHIYFMKPELVEQCNKLIAYHNKFSLGESQDITNPIFKR